jgi:acetylornithine deacetylase/succinyl-diaminopimelate desuccinylase-like protein
METVQILNDLISINSQTNKANSEIVSYIQSFYPDSERLEYSVNGEERNNLVVRIEGVDNDKKPLLIASHTDTVEPQEGWKTNPFLPSKKNGKIFGLGSSDMKGSIACLIASSIDCRPSGDIYLVFVGSEEDNSQGAKDLIRKIDFPHSQIIVPEPTNRIVYTKQNGYLEGVADGKRVKKRFNSNDENFREEESRMINNGANIVYSNPPYKTSEDSNLIRKIKSIDPSVKISKKPFKGWTEAGILKKYGDAIIWGAGDYEQCHKPNESIKIEDLDYFTWIFREIINYKR